MGIRSFQGKKCAFPRKNTHSSKGGKAKNSCIKKNRNGVDVGRCHPSRGGAKCTSSYARGRAVRGEEKCSFAIGECRGRGGNKLKWGGIKSSLWELKKLTDKEGKDLTLRKKR